MSRRRVTLTFDNGPTPGVTDGVLDVLGRHDVRATFFVVGRNLERAAARSLAERAADDGHWIGNHTMTHSLQFGAGDDPEAMRQEIERAQSLLGELAHPDSLFRPYCAGSLGPHVFSAASVEHLTHGGYTVTLWNSVPGDWKAPDEWVERSLRDIAAHDWSVVVLHDEGLPAMRHLPRFLEELEARGVEVVQEIPRACTPILRGEVIAEIGDLMPAPGTLAKRAT